MPLAVIVTVVLRLPFLTRWPSPDEAGFLMVGSQWHAGGTSLYGNYWVDRPPLLIALFQGSSALGGLPALRLLGCVAAAAVVLGSSVAARMIAGRRAARWSAVVAAALCTTPLLGTVNVNGELLGGPFVVGGIVAAIAALHSRDDGRAGQLAFLAGASAMSAVLIKQNLGDAFVFGLVATVVAWRRGDISGRRMYRVFASAAGGTVLITYAVALLTSLRGTSLGGVFDAMYPFRFAAGRVMADAGKQHAAGRLDMLVAVGAASGLALLLAMIVWGAGRHRLGGADAIGLCATLVFALISIAVGGNYWTHYLIELVVPTAILTGTLIARRQRFLSPLAATIVLASAVTWGIWHLSVGPSTGSVVGKSIAASAKPADTIVTAYGHADVDQNAGLSSPYAYLWSLPVKTLDPQLSALNRVLSGPQRPTWFVTWNKVPSWGLDSAAVKETVRREYHPVARVCGRTVYLRDGVSRPAPIPHSSCPDTSALRATLKEELP